MSSPTLRSVLVTRGHTQALKDGSVRPRSCQLEFEEVPTIVSAFRRMVRGLEFDLSEMAITTYLCAREHGKRFTALPLFVMRGLHHGAIVHNTTAGLSGPRDLEGRRVGVNRGYTVTTGVWARSILKDEYGVDLNRVTWVLSGDEHVAEYQPPPNVVPIEKGTTMEEQVLAGSIPAAVGVTLDDSRITPLIPNARQAGLAALRQRGLYPINHTVVVKDEILAANPGLARDLFEAFAAAKRPYIDRLAAGALEQPSKDDATFREVMEIVSDPLPYGIEPNRPMLETLVRTAMDQGILKRQVRIEDLFEPSTRDLIA